MTSNTHHQNNKRIAKNTIFLYFRMIVIIFLQLYISRRLLEILGVNDYGVYNLVAGFVTMFNFFSSSLSNGYQRFFNVALGHNNNNELSTLFSSALFIQLISISILILILETGGLWFLNNKLNIIPCSLKAANFVYQGVIIILIANMIRVPFQALIIAKEKMNFFAFASVLEVVLNLFIVLVLKGYANKALILYGLLQPLCFITVSILFIVYSNKLYKELSFRVHYNRQNVKDLASFSGWNIFGSLAHILKIQGVNIVLNMFFGVNINAARGFASQIQSGLSNLYINFQMASRPQMIQSYAQGDTNRMLNLAYSISRLSFMLLWLFSLPLILNINFILCIWLGNEIPSYTNLFSILSIVIAIIESFAAPIATMVHATGKMKIFQIVCSLTIISIIPISYIVLKLGFPPESALYTSIVILFFTQIIRIIIIRKLVQFSIKTYLVDSIFPCIQVLLLSLLVIVFLNFITNINYHTLLYITTVTLINILIIYVFGLNKNEKLIINNFINNKIFKSK